MKRLVASLAGATLLILVASCGEEDVSQEGLAGNAQTLLQEARAAMEALNSYHATITVSGEGIAGSGEVIEHEWAAPASFRSVTPKMRVEGDGACDVQSAGEVRHAGCTDVRGETLYGYGEGILVAGTQYGRLCQEKGSRCGEWEVRDAGPLAVVGVTFTQADWMITALTMIREAEIAGEENIDGLPTVHLKGRLNAAQAHMDTWRKAAQDAGLETVGEECVEQESTPVPEGVTPEAMPTPQCRPIGVEEFLALYQETVERQERDPGLVDVWIGVDDHLVRRFSATAPLDEPGEGEKTTIIDFSRFNEVVIEPPR